MESEPVPAPTFACCLCRQRHIALDDAALVLVNGEVICVACYSRDVERPVPVMPVVTYAAFRHVLRANQRERWDGAVRFCVCCSVNLTDDTLAVWLSATGGVCSECQATPAGRAIVSSPALRKAYAGDGEAGGSTYRCIQCDCPTERPLYSIKHLGFGLCDGCRDTELGGRLNGEAGFRNSYLKARGLPSPNETPLPYTESEF